MAITNFSGPITAGNIRNTTGTTVGENVKNTGQVVMSQSIMIDAKETAGAASSTYTVGVIPKNSQLIGITVRIAIASNAAGASTIEVGKTGDTNFFVTAVNAKAQGESSTLAVGCLDQSDRFSADTEIFATAAVAAGATATAGQITVTMRYIQANNLSDATKN